MIFQCEDCGSYFAEDEMTDGFEHLVQKYDKETGHSWIECPLCGCEIVDEPLQDHEIAEELNFYRLELRHAKSMVKFEKMVKLLYLTIETMEKEEKNIFEVGEMIKLLYLTIEIIRKEEEKWLNKRS